MKNKEKQKEYERKRYAANPERAKAKARAWRVANPERVKANNRAWRVANPERVKAGQREWRVAHREKAKASAREWQAANRKRDQATKRKWEKTKYLSDEGYAVKRRLRNLLRCAFNHYSKTGKFTTSRAYGVDFGAIVKHLGPCPGDRKCYHIDHIRPLVSFDFDDLEQVRLAFSPENHRWLLAKENMSKGAKWEKESEKSIGSVAGGL